MLYFAAKIVLHFSDKSIIIYDDLLYLRGMRVDSVIVSAPAKINWVLDITGLDEKNYHLLDMLMQRITLYDAVTVKKCDSGIQLSSSVRYIPTDERNTAYKAAKLFFEYSEISGGTSICIKKNIPSGAGLAGGSADAAAVLLGLNKLYGNSLSETELETLALKIGADVPFMLKSGLYRAKGIGEKLEKLPVKHKIPLLCVMKNNDPASTKAVYSLFDSIGTHRRPDVDGFINALDTFDTEKMCACGGNVLEDAACTVAKGISENIRKMNAVGARYTAMTGSGSAVFGVFDTIEAAKSAERNFSGWHCSCYASDAGTLVRELK